VLFGVAFFEKAAILSVLFVESVFFHRKKPLQKGAFFSTNLLKNLFFLLKLLFLRLINLKQILKGILVVLELILMVLKLILQITDLAL